MQERRNRAYYARNADAERARNRERSKSSAGRAWRARYRAENAEHEAETKALYVARNADAVRERKARHYLENREQYAASSARYHAENPHLLWESGYRARARKLGFDPVVERFTRAELTARYGDACAHCGGPFEQLDHYPVSVSRGGAHTLENARPSCADCNLTSWKGTEDAQQAV